MPVWNAFYLGVNTIIDPTEGNTTAESASSLVGSTFGAPGDPLLDTLTTVTTVDNGGSSTALDQNNSSSNDQFTTDIGNGPQTYTFDAGAAYSATITYVDGTTTTATVVIYQDTAGNTFMAPGLSDAANVPLLAGPIQSVELIGVVGNNYSGLAIDRPDITFLTCFVAGTRIDTPNGPRLVETLKVGDAVRTRDHGAQRLIWTGGRVVDGTGDFAPIRFAPGAMGNRREVLVSPQHRVLVSGWRAELFFGEPEVLVAAKALLNGDTIHRQPMARVSYHHIMCDRHEIVTSHGMETESFFPGDAALAGDAAIRAELNALFGDISVPGAPYRTARPALRVTESALLAR